MSGNAFYLPCLTVDKYSLRPNLTSKAKFHGKSSRYTRSRVRRGRSWSPNIQLAAAQHPDRWCSKKSFWSNKPFPPFLCMLHPVTKPHVQYVRYPLSPLRAGHTTCCMSVCASSLSLISLVWFAVLTSCPIHQAPKHFDPLSCLRAPASLLRT